MNRVELHGGLVGTPNWGFTRGGTAYASCTLAVSGARWDAELKKEIVATQFIRLQLWGGMAEQLMEMDPAKGEKLYVVGELDQSEYEDSDGKKQKHTRVRVTWFLPTNPKFTPRSPD